MSLFSKKKEEEKGERKENKIPKTLPDTVMQRLSVADDSQKSISPKKLYTEDLKASLQAKDENKRLPEDMHKMSTDKGPERHEVEQVLVIKEDQNKKIMSQQIVPQQSILQETDLREKHRWPSFFVELERMILSRKHQNKHLAAQDLIARMKEYHDSKNTGDVFFMHEFEIEEQIANSLSVLKDLESDWLHTKKQVSSAEKMLFEKERELEHRLADFKSLLLSAERFKAYNMVAQDGQVFFLSDGAKLYSVQQLIDEIPKMRDEIFFFHVTNERNDFASWIRDVFKLEELASKVLEAKTKEELLQILRGS